MNQFSHILISNVQKRHNSKWKGKQNEKQCSSVVLHATFVAKIAISSFSTQAVELAKAHRRSQEERLLFSPFSHLSSSIAKHKSSHVKFYTMKRRLGKIKKWNIYLVITTQSSHLSPQPGKTSRIKTNSLTQIQHKNILNIRRQ